jgi:hypothetical protein
MLTPGRFSSRASSIQSGSTRRRAPVLTPACVNSRFSSASSVKSSGNGQLKPAAAARFKLSWIVLRATPSRRPISRALTPSRASRGMCLNCRMVSSLFAGIPFSSSISTKRDAATADLRTADDRGPKPASDGRLHL